MPAGIFILSHHLIIATTQFQILDGGYSVLFVDGIRACYSSFAGLHTDKELPLPLRLRINPERAIKDTATVRILENEETKKTGIKFGISLSKLLKMTMLSLERLDWSHKLLAKSWSTSRHAVNSSQRPWSSREL